MIENVAGATLGILKGHDPDSYDPANSLIYSVAPDGDPSGRFEVKNGVLKLKDGVSLDYETATSYTVTVRVSDGHGGLKDQAFTINVQNVVVEPANRNPDLLTFDDGTTVTAVLENVTGATLGILKGHDPDSYDPANSLIYSLAPDGDPSGRFEVKNGVLKLIDGVSLDYETAPSYTVTVRVSDGHGGLKDQAFTINVQNLEVEPANRNPDSLSFQDGTTVATVMENVAGATLGILKGHDPDSYDPANSLIYSLAPDGDPSGRFEVKNGVLKLIDGVSLDYETATSYTVTVRVSDGHGGLKDQAFTIDVQNVVVEPANRNPDLLTFDDGTTVATVIENVAGATLGILKGHDPDSYDPANSLIYSLAPDGDPSGRFEVKNGVLKLIDGVSLDYETATSYTVTVRVSDGHGGFKDQAFTIDVQNVVVEPANQNPDSLTFADGTVVTTVAENVAGATLGILKGHDPDSYDPANSLIYSLAPDGDPSGRFEVKNGVLKLMDGVSLDYETATSYEVGVRVSDGHGGLKDGIFTIFVQNVVVEPANRNPDLLTFDDGTTLATVIENVAGATLGILKGHDPDSYDPANSLIYSLAPDGDPSGRFEVKNGVLKLIDGVSLDYETATSYTVTVRVSDGHGGLKDQAFTINVQNVVVEPANQNPGLPDVRRRHNSNRRHGRERGGRNARHSQRA